MERIEITKGLKRKYIIPCFQREYSWEKEEIEELVKNINDKNEKEEYCIGIVTVQDKKDGYLLIDGQQRITTLYLIGIYCGLLKTKEDILLTSEYDMIVSNKNNLVKILLNKEEDVPKRLIDGLKTIEQNIEDIDKFKKQLENVYYYEVDLTDNIDLNHYFEVMNSRGVQLSRSDIIKSQLMNKLSNDEDKYRLNHLWYDYEKMDSKNTNLKKFSDFSPEQLKSNYKTINDILKNKDRLDETNTNDLNDNAPDDKSILNFEYFLLYVIRLYKNRKENDLNISGEFNLNDLINEYENEFNNTTSKDIIKFLNFMIKMKNIYNTHIVKYDNKNETWSLDIPNDNTLLIQSCLRVSFINRRLMHWIYMTMKYFYNNSSIIKYNNIMRNYIRNNYIEKFLSNAKKIDYKTGFDTPNIILNYLDLLIKENYKYVESKIPEIKGIKPNKFKYKFRNSIEHFKPRHDKDGNENPDWVNDFGNLALLAYGTNTRMQNAEPDEKAKHFDKELSSYSLKLQIMTKITLKNEWDDKPSKKLRKIMIELLEKDLNN